MFDWRNYRPKILLMHRGHPFSTVAVRGFTPSLAKKAHAVVENGVERRNSMGDYRGIEYLRKKLNRKRSRVLRRYKFYEMKNIARDMGIATPPSLQWLQAVLGWNASGRGFDCGQARVPGVSR